MKTFFEFTKIVLALTGGAMLLAGFLAIINTLFGTNLGIAIGSQSFEIPSDYFSAIVFLLLGGIIEGGFFIARTEKVKTFLAENKKAVILSTLIGLMISVIAVYFLAIQLDGGSGAVAAMKNQPEKLQEVLNTSEVSQEKLNQWLIAGAQRGSTEAVQVLLDAGANPSALRQSEETEISVLMVAVLWGNHETVQTLINAGADVNFIDALGRTPLMHAVSAYDQEDQTITANVQSLLNAGADPRPVNSFNLDAAKTAKQYGHQEAYDLIMQELDDDAQAMQESMKTLGDTE